MSCTSGRLLVRGGRRGKAGSAAPSSYLPFLIPFHLRILTQHLLSVSPCTLAALPSPVLGGLPAAPYTALRFPRPPRAGVSGSSQQEHLSAPGERPGALHSLQLLHQGLYAAGGQLSLTPRTGQHPR